MAKKIESEDLFAKGLFEEQIKKAEELLVILLEVKSSIIDNLKEQKRALQEFKTITTVEDIRKLNEATEKVKQQTEALLKLEKENAAISKELAKVKEGLARASQQEAQASENSAKETEKETKAKRENKTATEEDTKAKNENTSASVNESRSLDELIERRRRLQNAIKSYKLDQKEDADLLKQGIITREEYNKRVNRSEAIITRQKQAVTELNVQIRREATLSSRLSSEYKKLSAELEKARSVYKNLAASGKATNEELQKQLNIVTQLDAKIKNIDASSGQFGRNVGNYPDISKIEGIGNQLLTLAGVTGGISFFRSSINDIAEFGQSLADLQAIVGVTDSELKFFEKSAIEIGKSSTTSAIEVVEAYKLIAGAKPELLENKEALDQVTRSAILLSEASGDALPEASKNLVSVMNQYGAAASETERYVNALAAGSQAGAAEIPDIAESLKNFGVVAAASNVSIEESVGLIETLAEKSITGAEAGTGLRNVLLTLNNANALPQKALKALNAAGVDTKILSDNTLSLSDRLEELSKIQGNSTAITAAFGKENVVVAQTLIENRNKFDEITAAVTGTNAAYEQAEIRTNTLQGSIEKLKNNFNATILEFGKGGGAVKEIVDFINRNLETIIKTVTSLVTIYATYKAAIVATNGVIKISEGVTNGLAVAKRLLAKNTEIATEATKKLNAAQKANIIGIVAAGITALTLAIVNYNKEASEAAQAQERLNKAFERNSEAIKENANQLQANVSKWEENYRRRIEIARSAGQSTVALEQEMNEKIIAEHDRFIENERKRIQQAEDLRKILIKQREETIKEALEVEKYAASLTDNQVGVERKRAEKRAKDLIDINVKNQTDLIAQNIDFVKQSYAQIEEYEKLKTEAQRREMVRRNELSQEELKQIKKWQQMLRQLQVENMSDEISRTREKEKFRYEILVESVKSEVKNTQLRNAILEQLEIEHRRNLLKIDLDYSKQVKHRVDAYFDVEKTRYQNRQKDKEKNTKLALQQEMDYTKNIEIEARKRGESEEKINRRIRDARIQELQQVAYFRKRTQDEEIEMLKLLAEVRSDEISKTRELKDALVSVLDEINNAMNEASEKRIRALDKEVDAAKSRTEELRRVAERGILDADKSIAAEERKMQEAEMKKIEEEEKRQRRELFLNVLKTYGNKLDNNEGNALSSTISDIGTLMAFARSLPGYYEGVEELKRSHAFTSTSSAKDPLIIRAHPGERIMSDEHNKRIKSTLGNITNESLVKLIESESATSVPIFTIEEKRVYNFERIEDKLNELIRVNKNKPVQKVYVDEIKRQIVEEIHEGEKIKRVHFAKKILK